MDRVKHILRTNGVHNNVVHNMVHPLPRVVARGPSTLQQTAYEAAAAAKKAAEESKCHDEDIVLLLNPPPFNPFPRHGEQYMDPLDVLGDFKANKTRERRYALGPEELTRIVADCQPTVTVNSDNMDPLAQRILPGDAIHTQFMEFIHDRWLTQAKEQAGKEAWIWSGEK